MTDALFVLGAIAFLVIGVGVSLYRIGRRYEEEGYR